MAIKLKRTGEFATSGIKTVIYGGSGVGKTSLIKTIEDSVIISAEKGLLSIVDDDLPYIEVNNPSDIDDAYNFVRKDKEFSTIFLDTVSEIGETLLTNFLLTGTNGGPVKDGRIAYRLMAEAMMPMIRKFRDLPEKNVIFLAKMQIREDEENGIWLYQPMLPGRVIKEQLPYMFDGVYMMDIKKDKDKNNIRVFQTGATKGIYCKDRSGKLDIYEPADLTHVFNKIKGNA